MMTYMPHTARLPKRMTMAAMVVAMIGGVALTAPVNAADDIIPNGDWSRFCTNARMNGHDLHASCRRADGAMVNVEANVQACNGTVTYNPEQSKFLCAYGAATSYGQGYWTGYGPAYGPGYIQAYGPNGPYYRTGDGLPPGQWRERCNDASMNGDVLKASCQRADGSYRAIEASVGDCAGREVVYSPRDERFSCGTQWQNASSGHFPTGKWKESCTNASMNGWILRAQYQTKGGQIQSSEVATDKCPFGGWNDNGWLSCQ